MSGQIVTEGPPAKGERMRENITHVTIDLLIEHGFGGTSILRIIERAQVSRGALQHHFPTKEDLIAAVVERLLSRPLRRMHPRDEGAPADVKRSMRAAWDEMINTDAYRALLEILVAARTDRGLATRIEPMLHDWNTLIDRRNQAYYASVAGHDDDVELIMIMHRALLRGLVVQDRFVDDPAYIDRVVNRWIQIAGSLLEVRR